MLLVEAPHLASIRWPRLSSIASMADNRCERRQVEGVDAREGEGARRETGGGMEGGAGVGLGGRGGTGGVCGAVQPCAVRGGAVLARLVLRGDQGAELVPHLVMIGIG